MKKLLLILALFMGALIVNAQTTSIKIADLPKPITAN
jgi:hypothetical protein